jgi:hypothetical protein
MEARLARRIASLLTFVFSIACSAEVPASGYRTRNFTVSAPTPQLAKEIGDSAEHWRRELAVDWLGREMPPWSKPCPIHARVAPRLGAGGATSFVFDRGEVYDWQMNIQGTRERILDSVLPHEVTHTVFACYFRQPLPRWADEGACTTVEHPSEIAKQERMLIDFLKTRRGISFSRMFAMKEYPRDVMPLYSQGHALAQMLIESRGKKVFLDFLGDGMQDENWPRAVKKYYGHENLYALQQAWLDWVKNGRPRLGPATGPNVQIASTAANNAANSIYRGQSPDAGNVPVTPINPAAQTAQQNQSVYATLAAQADEQDRRRRDDTSRQPVYDASLPREGVRR